MQANEGTQQCLVNHKNTNSRYKTLKVKGAWMRHTSHLREETIDYKKVVKSIRHTTQKFPRRCRRNATSSRLLTGVHGNQTYVAMPSYLENNEKRYILQTCTWKWFKPKGIAIVKAFHSHKCDTQLNTHDRGLFACHVASEELVNHQRRRVQWHVKEETASSLAPLKMVHGRNSIPFLLCLICTGTASPLHPRKV